MNKKISNMKKPEINIIVPLYNEKKVYDQLISRLQALIDSSELRIEVILVDDRSKDETTRLLEEVCIDNPKFQVVFLSRNFGEQIAITAGLKYVNASKAVLIIDGDLQHPQGFTALLFTIVLFGGIQLISIGLIGSYIVRIFFQVKNRPLFIVKKRIAHCEI